MVFRNNYCAHGLTGPSNFNFTCPLSIVNSGYLNILTFYACLNVVVEHEVELPSDPSGMKSSS